MKISVGSRAGRSGNQPHRLCLGRCCLPVSAVLDCYDEGDNRMFDVRVLDGRRFVVRHRSEPEQWELVAAPGRTVRRKPVVRPATMLMALILAALSRRAFASIKRTCAGKRDTSSGTLPSGDAPA